MKLKLNWSDETSRLSNLIFDDILRRENKYRYTVNNQDFDISRYCNGVPKDGAQDHDLIVKVISPIDPNFADYDSTACANLSQNTNDGAIIIKLQDHNSVFDDIRTFIKTEKFLRRNTGSRPEQQQLLTQKGIENQNLGKRIFAALEDALKDAEYYALGSAQQTKGSTPSTILNTLYQYVIENTFGKLKLVKPFPGEIKREIQQTLIADDVTQIGLDLSTSETNPIALSEIESYLVLSDDAGRPVTAEDIIKRFSKRPYGWNTDEILLLLARLGLANKLSFQMRQQDIQLRDVYDSLIQVRKRSELRVRRVKQQSEGNIKKAQKLFKDIFNKNAPESEKELFATAQANLSAMKSNLDSYATKQETFAGRTPGKKEIEDGKVLLAQLTEIQSSFQFIETFNDKADEFLDFEEDYQELNDFFESQFSTWQRLYKALEQDFARNRSALEKQPDALDALSQLDDIYHLERPYRKVRDIDPLIEKVSKVNDTLLADKREDAKKAIESHILRIQAEVKTSRVTSEISNEILRPLQLLIENLSKLNGLADIAESISEASDYEDEAYECINHFIESQQTPPTSKKEHEVHEEPTHEKPVPISPKAKKIVSVNTAEIAQTASHTGVIETQEQIDTYVSALKAKLSELVAQNNKVRIK